MQICTERINENDTLMFLHANIVPDIHSSGEPESIVNTDYR